MDKKHYCPIPFNHLAIRPNGKVFPCCNFRWEETPEDMDLGYDNLFFDHPFMKKIRKDLLEDKPVEGCSRCYESEQHTGKSMRTDYIRIADKLGLSKKEEPELTYIDLALSNVCNNKCRMCGPELSTNWYSDAKKLGIEIPRGLLEHKNDLKEYNLSNLRLIKLIGGEPLMEQEKFIEILERCTLENLSVLITTNTTIQPNKKLLSLLEKCHRVKWNLSIDAYGPLNDFLRKGSKWDEIDRNVDWFKETFSEEFVSIDSVASIYNINVLHHLIDYAKSKSIPQRYVMCDGPNWMHPRNLPSKVKLKVKEILTTKDVPNANYFIHEMEQQGNFKLFVKHDNTFNELRKEHWASKNPELLLLLEKYLNEYTEENIL